MAHVLSAYNDEIAHVNYALHLQTNGSLPTQIEPIDAPGALERGQFENYQPPLYYTLVAGVGSLTGTTGPESLAQVGRALSIAAAAGMVLVFLSIARTLTLTAPVTAAGVIILSLQGVLVRFTSTAGNEALFWLLAGVLIDIALRLRQSGGEPRHLLLFGLFAVLALYTKLTALVLLPLPLVALPRRCLRERIGWLLPIFAAVVLLTLPVWLRNHHEFGSLLPLTAGFGVPAWQFPGFMSVVYAVRTFVFPWAEFWQGLLGLVFMLPALVYFAWQAVRARRVLRDHPALGFALAAAILSYLWLNLRYNQPEGRYLFSAWPALVLLCAGFRVPARSLWILLFVLLLPYMLFLLPAGA